jgi:phosphinothricin acetyltransferase
MSTAELRQARADDWPTMRSIFLEGIATGQSSFEVPESVPLNWDQWIRYRHRDSVFVLEERQVGIQGWCALAPTSPRHCYRGVAEVQLYISDGARGQGLGKHLLSHLVRHSEEAGFWTLQAIVFPENAASRRLFSSQGFREVGYRERIARMNGEWRDTLLLERRSPAF